VLVKGKPIFNSDGKCVGEYRVRKFEPDISIAESGFRKVIVLPSIYTDIGFDTTIIALLYVSSEKKRLLW
jgi:hypothetical protein